MNSRLRLTYWLKANLSELTTERDLTMAPPPVAQRKQWHHLEKCSTTARVLSSKGSLPKPTSRNLKSFSREFLTQECAETIPPQERNLPPESQPATSDKQNTKFVTRQASPSALVLCTWITFLAPCLRVDRKAGDSLSSERILKNLLNENLPDFAMFVISL